MEESDVILRKRCTTDKIPTKRSLVDVVGSQYRQTEKQRETNMVCVNSWARPAGSSVYWSVLFVCSSSTLATVSF